MPLWSLDTKASDSVWACRALATLTTLPVVVIYLMTQKYVIEGMISGAVKG